MSDRVSYFFQSLPGPAVDLARQLCGDLDIII